MSPLAISRRDFLRVCGASAPLLALACDGPSPTEPDDPFAAEASRLRLRQRGPVRGTVTGTDVLYGAGFQRAYLRVPPSYNPKSRYPLVIAFHGLGGRGDLMANAFGPYTDAMEAILLAPDSISQTWDLFDGDIGPDMVFINGALDQTFERCAIDASRVALLGFSDGATYALTLALSNGDQVTGSAAFSPGFFDVINPHGTPPFFVAHGTADEMLDIDATSRQIVPALQARGCTVTYVEHAQGHVIPTAIAQQGMDFLETRLTGL